MQLTLMFFVGNVHIYICRDTEQEMADMATSSNPFARPAMKVRRKKKKLLLSSSWYPV